MSFLARLQFLLPICLPGSALNDGQWHSVELNSRRGRLSISVDKGEGGSAQASPSFTVTTQRDLFFGGKIWNSLLNTSKAFKLVKLQTALWTLLRSVESKSSLVLHHSTRHVYVFLSVIGPSLSI